MCGVQVTAAIILLHRTRDYIGCMTFHLKLVYLNSLWSKRHFVKCNINNRLQVHRHETSSKYFFSIFGHDFIPYTKDIFVAICTFDSISSVKVIHFCFVLTDKTIKI